MTGDVERLRTWARMTRERGDNVTGDADLLDRAADAMEREAVQGTGPDSPETVAEALERVCKLGAKAQPDGTFSCPGCPNNRACIRAASETSQ